MRKRFLIIVGAALVIAALLLTFLVAPPIEGQGASYRIFYFHVPIAWVAFFAFLMTFIWSITYLVKRNMKWDFYASASAEIGLVFTTLILITGSIWAKSAWGTWWTWDLRLTTSLVLWLIYVAYFLLRGYVSDEERRARFGAVVGIIGFIDVPVVALAISLVPTTHPPPLIFEGGLTDWREIITLVVGITAFTVLYFVLLGQRVALKYTEDVIKKLKAE
ncbi:MAG TPA: cytochrome c biogenesis protein CcsA [Dehalococcoidales bacterium]|nr:cytochrome c biogenesis protein CcsA [Dehalococcoidales bacterium]